MSVVAIARLGPDDAELVRELRLELLNAHPEAFAADPDYEGSLSLDDWRQRLGAAERCWLVARVGDEVAGLCVFSRITHTRKRAHVGDIGSMYVRAAFRGAGVADALMNAMIDLAQEPIEQILLTVNAENPRAIAFYERHGFRKVGLVPRALRVGDRYYDEIEMIRPVSASD